MTIRTIGRRLLERSTSTHIFARLAKLPRGVDLNVDLKRYLPNYNASFIFDVGANIGQSAEKYLRWFPQAEIYCFEPVSYSFANLQQKMGKFANVHCVCLALGDTKGELKMVVDGNSSMNAVWSEDTGLTGTAELETVEAVTLSEFCLQNSIERISFLKMDTEGHDLAVLRGAEGLLNEHKIDLIQAEAGMNPTNRDHVPFEDLKSFLECKGYFLFGIYEQVGEWPTKQPNLRRTNPVFLAKNLME